MNDVNPNKECFDENNVKVLSYLNEQSFLGT
jgi:hypothetical protein